MASFAVAMMSMSTAAGKFLGKKPRPVVFLPYVMTCVGCRSSSSITKWAVRVSQKRFDLESPKFYTNIHTDLVYGCTGQHVTSYFRSEVIAKKTGNYRFRQTYRGQLTAQNLPDTTSLADCARLQNAIKYLIKVGKTRVAGKESNNSATV